MAGHYARALAFWAMTALLLPPLLFVAALAALVAAAVGSTGGTGAVPPVAALERRLLRQRVAARLEHVTRDVRLVGARPLRCRVHLVRVSAGGGGEPPAVLVHGIAGSCLSLATLIDALAAERDVVALDLPGFGRSHADAAATAILREFPDPAEFYLRVLEACLPPRALLVGHSYGAYLCVRFAARFPERVAGLGLISPVGIFPTLGAGGAYWGAAFKHGWRGGRLLGAAGRALAIRLLEELPLYWYCVAAHPRAFGGELVAAHISLTTFSCAWRHPALAALASLRCPVGLVYGAADGLSPPHQGEALRELLPGLGLLVVPGAGHNPVTAGAELVAALTRAGAAAPRRGPRGDFGAVDLARYRSSFDRAETARVIAALYADLRAVAAAKANA